MESKSITNIRRLLEEALSETKHQDDYIRCIKFIDSREFVKLQELVKAIIVEQELVPKEERSDKYIILIEVKAEVDQYVDQLTYKPETDGDFDF